MAEQVGSSGLTMQHRFSTTALSFLTQFGGRTCSFSASEQEMDVIMLDHCYTKPWSAHPDASNARPVRMLFMTKLTRPSALETLQNQSCIDPPIDIVGTPLAPSMPFDISKARNLMTECERHTSYARPDSQEDWEEKISKVGWTIQQNRAFSKVIKALQADRLARLAMDSVANEPVARRQLVDKTAKRLRQALAGVAWDLKVVQWLHHLILDTVSVHLLASYLDALQTLKSKVPSLVEKMISGSPPKHPSLTQESLGLLLKRPWDPVGNALLQHKLRKLPNNPLLLLAPSGPTQGSSGLSGQAKRLKFWQAHLNSLGKTITVNMSGGSGVSMMLCLEQMIGALRTKVLEQKSHVQNRPIILVGWNIGALVSCHVSLVESVSAVVCLGFPFIGIHGPRGDCEDPLLGSQTPTLFVIGQNASDCSIDQLQDLREHMRVETGMLVVGGADEQLRLSHRQKREEGLTQAMADRCIVEEVYQFLGSILSMSSSSPDHTPVDVVQTDLRKKRKGRLSRDLIGGAEAESNSRQPLGTGVDPTINVTSVSRCGIERTSKRGGKAARYLTASGGSALSTERVRTAPKKRQGRGGLGVRKQMAFGIGQLGVHTARSSVNLQSVNTATLSAVSSAPELYGLLQSIPKEGDSVVFGGTRPLMGTSFSRTKLLTFSKTKEKSDVGNSVSGSVPATVLASALCYSDGSEKDKLTQQQILVRTGGLPSTPLTIPISMSPRLVASALGVTSPLVHITGAGTSSSPHIHQLLTNSVARNSVSTTTSVPQAALLINTTAASTASIVPTSLGIEGGREGILPDQSEHLENDTNPNFVEKLDNTNATVSYSQKEDSKDKVMTSVQSSQYHDFPLTTSSLSHPAVALTQTSSTNPTTMLTKSSLTNPPIILNKASVSSPAINLTETSLTNPTTVLIQAKTSISTSGLPTTSISKPALLQLTKSLINSASVSASSILGKVVAGSVVQTGRTGSAVAASPILGSRNTVLISTSIAKCLSSVSTANLLNKSNSESNSVPATFVPNREMLGKVSPVLESNASRNQVGHGQTVAGITPPVSRSFPLSKPEISNATGVCKSSDGFTSSQVSSSPLSVESKSTVTTTTPSSPTITSTLVSSGGSGRGGHRPASSVSYTTSTKPVFPTISSTRTRRIRTPRQYDL